MSNCEIYRNHNHHLIDPSLHSETGTALAGGSTCRRLTGQHVHFVTGFPTGFDTCIYPTINWYVWYKPVVASGLPPETR
jgi:hypothetical protein